LNQKHLHNISWIPIVFIGLGTIILGAGWLFHPEPWLLDQPPNETLLKTTFVELFRENINKNLPDYLLVIYRFLGWWIISIGMLIIGFVQVTRMGSSLARNLILIIIFIILTGAYYMVLNFLPTSPFKIFMHFFAVLWFLSVIGSMGLKK